MSTALTATDPNSSTDVSISATILINGQEIPINSESIANLKNGIKFNLPSPVNFGTLEDMLTYINNNFGTSLSLDSIKSSISSLPSALSDLKTALLGIIDSNLILTILNIDTATGLFQIGITIAPQSPVKILGPVELESIGFGISHTESGGNNDG